ncbi:MAG: sulfatase-like hydrolase/transferase [Fuerstiella sp.]
MKNIVWRLLSLMFVCSSVARAADRPNIVFFFTDDQTTSTLGCYGNDVVQTPNIDQLAKQGTRFSNAFVSHSICWVSRTTILTGLTGRSYGTPGARDQARAEAVQTFYSDILRDNGYRTGYFGKWHARMPKEFKREDHFDEFEAIGRNPFYKKQADGSIRHETEVIVDRGIDFVKSQPKGKPFALNMWFNSCHAEDGDRRPGIGHFAWPRAVDGMYDDLTIAPAKLNDPAIFEALPDFLKTTINRERFFWRWNTEERYQTNVRAYYRMVSGIDGAIGRFRKMLAEQGLAENTIIVYSADNGYYMGNRGLAGKWSHFDESLRVPMIVMDPRVSKDQQGKVASEIALNLDLPATFLDWAGVEVPSNYQGRSLQAVVSNDTVKEWRTDSFHEHFAVRNRIPAFEGIRNEQFKYVRYVDHDRTEFLHDLINDPDELVNLADDSKFEQTLADMRKRTDERVEELGGPLLPMTQKFNPSTVPHPAAAAALVSPHGRDGFANLFNGRNLQQWDGDKKYWSVKDGAITGVTDGSLKKNRFLTWKLGTVQNFDLRIKVKVSGGGNSGLQYRGTSVPDIGIDKGADAALDIVHGYQCDVVADNSKYNGMLYEEKGRRILSHAGEKVIVDPQGRPWVVGQMPVKEFASDEWHDYRVLVQGNHHQHWIDGHMTADLVDLDEKGRKLEGVLAVQVHVGPAMTIQYKDIKMKHLPDDLPILKQEDQPIPADAYGVRPQGRLPKGWKPPVYGQQ